MLIILTPPSFTIGIKPGERPFAIFKRVFKAAHVLVTTVERVNVKMVFTAIAFNLFQLRTLRKAGLT